ncbi:hypothetical protein NU08_4562 [Flavobacterium anhuiense]|uniref:Uncharacterized protein n=1 Tax=Flavobacterium anhuiense TaxID=459526 RepID=A0A444VSL3_9FLAO|nr:hypothetical protein NU08_4562 [Flavobacterium anhuiense]
MHDGNIMLNIENDRAMNGFSKISTFFYIYAPATNLNVLLKT